MGIVFSPTSYFCLNIDCPLLLPSPRLPSPGVCGREVWVAGRAGEGRGEKGREWGEAKQINIFCTCVSYGLVSLFVFISLPLS